jgi:hypothetical protein
MPTFKSPKPVLPASAVEGLSGVTEFFASSRTRTWLAEAIKRSLEANAEFCMDYTVRITADLNGTTKVRLLATSGGARQLQLWTDE